MLTYEELLPRLEHEKSHNKSAFPRKSYELYRAAFTRQAVSGEDFRISVIQVTDAIVVIIEQTGRNGEITSLPYAELTADEMAADTYKYVALIGDNGAVLVTGPTHFFSAHFDLAAPVIAAGLAQLCVGGGWIGVEPGRVRCGKTSEQFGAGPHEEAAAAFTEAVQKLGLRTERYS